MQSAPEVNAVPSSRTTDCQPGTAKQTAATGPCGVAAGAGAAATARIPQAQTTTTVARRRMGHPFVRPHQPSSPRAAESRCTVSVTTCGNVDRAGCASASTKGAVRRTGALVREVHAGVLRVVSEPDLAGWPFVCLRGGELRHLATVTREPE